jgi:hypothetical protein
MSVPITDPDRLENALRLLECPPWERYLADWERDPAICPVHGRPMVAIPGPQDVHRWMAPAAARLAELAPTSAERATLLREMAARVVADQAPQLLGLIATFARTERDPLCALPALRLLNARCVVAGNVLCGDGTAERPTDEDPTGEEGAPFTGPPALAAAALGRAISGTINRAQPLRRPARLHLRRDVLDGATWRPLTDGARGYEVTTVAGPDGARVVVLRFPTGEYAAGPASAVRLFLYHNLGVNPL